MRRARHLARTLISKAPLVDGLFRRLVWSRLHFPEREMEVLARLPRGAMDVAVDVGAARGSYAWILSRKARRVFAFEPGQRHFAELSRLKLGTRVEPVHAAVGRQEGVLSLYTPGHDETALHSATLSEQNPAARRPDVTVEQVPVVTLDGFLTPRLAGRSLDLIKIDVEGFELEVLRGAAAVIERHHPVVICEIEARHNRDHALVFEWLRSRGYACFVHRPEGATRFEGVDLAPLQREEDYAVRVGPEHDPHHNRYINNFVFQHPASRVPLISDAR